MPLLQRRIFYKAFLVVINDSLLSKFALVSLNLPSLHTVFIAWCTVKGHEGQPHCGEQCQGTVDFWKVY